MSAWLPSVRAVMGRRILVNYRVRPEVIERCLPKPFRPKIVHGWGLAGLCLIRLEALRPGLVPAWLGLGSENAAHRFAVEWDGEDGVCEGVFIPRRDTNSVLNRWAGGRLFPGVSGAADFRTDETDGRLTLEMESRDGEASIRLEVEPTDRWPERSVFGTLEEASAFFRAGCCGWSPTRDGAGLEGAALDPETWAMTPLRVCRVMSSYFADTRRFPAGSLELDSAILMRGIAHAWRDMGRMPCRSAERRSVPRGTHGVSALFHWP